MTIDELTARVETLERLMREFSSAPELSPDIKRTITAILATSSSKSVASGSTSVNEAGASTYSVMKIPTGFINIGGFDVPYI